MANKPVLDLKNVPQELKLIIELMKEGNEEYLKENSEVLTSGVNWNHFIDLVFHHRLHPLMNAKLKLLDKHNIPAAVFTSMNVAYKKNTFQMLHLSAEMQRVNQIFDDNQIRLLFLKGPVLAQELYGDISLRTSSDLDFLVPIEDLEASEALLSKLGYEKDDYIQTVLSDWRWRHHHVTYIHPVKGTKLEIHWRLHPGPGAEQTFDELWKRKIQSTPTAHPVYLLGKEDLFLFLTAHGARHGWSRLRWLIDIHQLVVQGLEWTKIHNLLKRYHIVQIGGQAIILSTELLNARVPKEVNKRFRTDRTKKLAQAAIYYLESMIHLHSEPLPEEVSEYHKRHLFSLMSFKQKALFILSFMYPYPEDAKTLPLPKSLHFLYFPLRPFLWAWRKLKRTRKHALP